MLRPPGEAAQTKTVSVASGLNRSAAPEARETQKPGHRMGDIDRTGERVSADRFSRRALLVLHGNAHGGGERSCTVSQGSRQAVAALVHRNGRKDGGRRDASTASCRKEDYTRKSAVSFESTTAASRGGHEKGYASAQGEGETGDSSPVPPVPAGRAGLTTFPGFALAHTSSLFKIYKNAIGK